MITPLDTKAELERIADAAAHEMIDLNLHGRLNALTAAQIVRIACLDYGIIRFSVGAGLITEIRNGDGK